MLHFFGDLTVCHRSHFKSRKCFQPIYRYCPLPHNGLKVDLTAPIFLPLFTYYLFVAICWLGWTLWISGSIILLLRPYFLRHGWLPLVVNCWGVRTTTDHYNYKSWILKPISGKFNFRRCIVRIWQFGRKCLHEKIREGLLSFLCSKLAEGLHFHFVWFYCILIWSRI